MRADTWIMLHALFPDAVDYAFIPKPSLSEWVRDSATGTLLSTEDLKLEPITEAKDVWACMSPSSRRVYVYEGTITHAQDL